MVRLNGDSTDEFVHPGWFLGVLTALPCRSHRRLRSEMAAEMAAIQLSLDSHLQGLL